MNWLVKYKDQVTNVCGLVFAVSGALLATPSALPEQYKPVVTLAGALAGALIGFLTGKDPKNG